MRVFAALAGTFFLFTIPQAISPWGTFPVGTGIRALPLHRWSSALAGGPDLGTAAVLFYLVWRPLRAPLALQWLALSALVFWGANGPFVPSFFTWAWIAIPVVLAVALYPHLRQLLMAPWSAGVNGPLLGLGVFVAIFLLPDAAISIAAQIRRADVLASSYNWAANAEHLIILSLMVVLAGMNRPGARVLGIVAGVVLAFLGVSALAVPDDPGSWGTYGGGLAIAVGLCIAMTAAYDSLRDRESIAVEPASAR